MSSISDVEGIDMPVLEKAQEILHAPTQTEAVNAALREFVRRRVIENLIQDVAARDPRELEDLRRDAWSRKSGSA